MRNPKDHESSFRPGTTSSSDGSDGTRLDSWKEIATYLRRDVRTVRRWEGSEGLPVHRHHHNKSASVYAFMNEIDVWRRRRSVTQRRPVIAVLPFKNSSGNPDQEHIADGLTDALIAGLGRIGGEALGVIARTTAMTYKDRELTISQIANELSLDYVVEGSVRWSDTRATVTVRLVRGDDQCQVWAKIYDDDLSRTISIERNVAQRIACSLLPKLRPEAFPQAQQIHPVAYDNYLQGRYYCNRRTPEALWMALTRLEQALDREPRFAPAAAGLADCYSLLAQYGSLCPRDAFPKARHWAKQACEHDPELAEAHASLAAVSAAYDWDWDASEAGFTRALELDPTLPAARQWLAELRFFLGRPDWAEPLRSAEGLDPLSPVLPAVRGWLHYFAREPGLAIAHCVRALELDPDLALGHIYLGLAYGRCGLYERSLDELEVANQLAPSEPYILAALAHAHAVWGEQDRALRLRSDLAELATHRYVPPFAIAQLAAGLGDKDLALQALGDAREERSDKLVWLNADPMLDCLREEPRFQEIVVELGLSRN